MKSPTIMSTQGIGAANGVKMLVYGRAGRGKTTLCATCPNPIIFSAESGLLALSDHQLPYVEVKTVDDLTDLYNWCKSSSEARQFQTICIDSLSEIGEVVLSNAKAQKVNGKLIDPRQAYGLLIEQMTKTIRAFRDLPGFHVYMSAKQEFNKDETTGVMMNGPSMPGAKLSQQLPYFFDEVFQLDIGKLAPNPSVPGDTGQSYRFLRTQPDFQNDAKDRSGRLDPIEEPHLGKIIQKIA
jgi:hypothetical protein